jgi:hypothetical protein
MYTLLYARLSCCAIALHHCTHGEQSTTHLAWKHSTSRLPAAFPLQVVVVGASETGLAALHQLLLHPHLEFTCLTLIAPGGLSGPATAGSYSYSLLARLALDTRVVVLPGRVVALDRGQQLVQLDDGAVVAYDLLLLAAGLQVGLPPSLAGWLT